MPSVHTDLLARTRAYDQRVRKLTRAQNDLWFLLGELGYHWNPEAGGEEGASIAKGRGLTEYLHKPICDWYDRNQGHPQMGLWLQRAGHKTTLMVGWVVQKILRDPYTYGMYFHAVDSLASDFAAEVAHLFQHNKFLRSLDPIGKSEDGDVGQIRCLPAHNAKRFLNAEGFTLRRPDWAFSRFKTLYARGAGAEITGAHGLWCVGDDIIGRNDIEDNQLPKKARWWQNTVVPVVDGFLFRIIGTAWADWGLYPDWWDDPEWRTMVIPGSTRDMYRLLETGERSGSGHTMQEGDPQRYILDPSTVDWEENKVHLAPARNKDMSYDLRWPVYGPPSYRKNATKLLELKQRQMKGQFPPQMMNDPVPAGDRPWLRVEEDRLWIPKFSTERELGIDTPGTFWVLSDPAPATIGSLMPSDKEKARGDSTKDFWAIAVVMVRRVVDRIQRILVDGDASRSWTLDEGMDRCCELMLKWGTPYCLHEAYGGLQAGYEDAMLRASDRNGRRWKYLDANQKPLRFELGYQSGAKTLRFGDLVSLAQQGEFKICKETVPKSFLYGDGSSRHSGFFPQVRNWRKLESGGNSLEYDDHGDITARATDPTLIKWVPRVEPAGMNPHWRAFKKGLQHGKGRMPRPSRVRHLRV